MTPLTNLDRNELPPAWPAAPSDTATEARCLLPLSQIPKGGRERRQTRPNPAIGGLVLLGGTGEPRGSITYFLAKIGRGGV
jgi:hypothetical protein